MFGDDRSQLLLVSEETLNDEAKQAYDEVINQAKANGTLNADENFSKRVDMISKRLIDYAPELRAESKNWNWEVNTIKDPTVNAWCMPGGKICVYTGLNDTLNLTDDELASIIGHEISHALKEHSREKRSQASLQSGLTSVAKILGVKRLLLIQLILHTTLLLQCHLAVIRNQKQTSMVLSLCTKRALILTQV